MRTILLTASALALMLSACGKPQQAPPKMPPPPVGVAKPILKTMPSTQEYTGRIEAKETVEIRSRVNGFIREVLVRDGAEVKEGDTLFVIDDAPLKAVVAGADAEAVAAKARRDQAQLTADRNRKLVQDQVVSQQVADDSDAALRTAEAQYTAARAMLMTAKLDLGYARITSPISGRIGKVLVTQGNLIQPHGMAPGTHLATIVSTDPMEAVFNLDEVTYHRLGERLRASGSVSTTPSDRIAVQVGLAGQTGHPYSGHITFVDNQVDTGSGSIRVRATIPDPRHELTPGAFARILVEVAPPRQVVLVNTLAIQSQLTTRYVLTVDEKGGTGFRPVQLGATIPPEHPMLAPMRVVEHGLGPDDRIAVNNLAKIFFPGMPVSPIPASMVTTQNDAPPAGAATTAPPEAAKPEAAKPETAKP